MDPSARDILRKKLRDQKKKRNKGIPTKTTEINGDNILDMFNEVNNMLKRDPGMAKKVSECVSNMFQKNDLMSTLVNEIQKESKGKSTSQSFENNDLEDSSDASENESKQ